MELGWYGYCRRKFSPSFEDNVTSEQRLSNRYNGQSRKQSDKKKQIKKLKAVEVYHALTFTEAEKGNYNALVGKFQKLVEGKKELAHECYVFNNRDQNERETFLSFLTITSQARKCGFDHVKYNMIRDRIISGLWSERTKAKLRDLADPDLNTVRRLCKNDEITKTCTRDSKNLAVHQVKHRQGYLQKKNVNKNNYRDNREKKEHVRREKKECERCGYQHPDRTCPPKGHTCRDCKNVGHFKTFTDVVLQKMQRKPEIKPTKNTANIIY